MAKLLLIKLVLLYFLGFNHVSGQVSSKDSTQLAQKQAENSIKVAKNKKPFVIKRIKTKDSTIIYGADKLKTHIVHINYYNRAKGKFLQFTYDENGLIFLGVLPGSKGANDIKKKKNSAYHFSKGVLIYSQNWDVADDLPSLLIESERLLNEGKSILNSYR